MKALLHCPPDEREPGGRGRYAVIVRDTGEVLYEGDQSIDPERVRFMILAELAEEEKDLRGKPTAPTKPQQT
jgi:hypothetical protein